LARNGSGVFTKINTFVSGNSITAAGHNQNFDDVATEITNSVAADGQTTMTGPLKAASGTANAPGITFASDPDSGLYRIGSNNVGAAVNGTKVLDIATTGLGVTGTLAATGAISQNGFALLPVGLGPLPWSGLTAPSGWVLAYGQTLSRTTYAALWTFAQTEIAGGNTLYGNGDGSTNFTIADMRGRLPAGKDNMGGSAASRLGSGSGFSSGGALPTVLGAAAGLETHTNTLAQLPTGITSTGTVTTQTPNIVTADSQVTTISLSTGGATSVKLWAAANTVTVVGSINSTGTLTSNNTSGAAHNNVQPTIITNYIIFAGV
jgi:Microcystin-dependent protein